MSPQTGRILKENDQVVNQADMLESIYKALVIDKNAGVSITGNLPNQTLAEQLTEANAVLGVLTFSSNVTCLQIYNSDAVNLGVFNVNGIDITVPAGTATPKFSIGGIPSVNILVSGSTAYIMSRFT